MAGKKKQGIAGLKDTTGGARRDDRNATAKYFFDPISIDAENALTVIFMLSSPENNVVLRAVASLERFGKKSRENLELLTGMGIFEYILPLLQHEDYLVRRFAQKLIALLCSLEEFRHMVLADDMTVNIFVTILDKEDDVVMHEFSTLTLAELSSECYAAGRILQIDGCVDVLYLRVTSLDPDVQKNCLDTIKNLLNEIDGMQYFVFSPSFGMKPFLDLTSSSYPVIQVTTLQVIDKFLTWSMDNKILFALRDALGIETIIGIAENEQWSDLHMLALDIVLKVVDNPVICEYLHQSGCLKRLINLLDDATEKEYTEKVLGALARISQCEEGRKALHAYNMGQIFAEYLRHDWVYIQEPACLGVANMGKYPPAADSIMSARPTPQLLDILTDPSNKWKLREMASYALNILSHEDHRVADDLMEGYEFERLLPFLNDDRSVPVEMIQNILQIFIGVSSKESYRFALITENLMRAVMGLVQDLDEPYLKPASVQITALECISGLLVEDAARTLFHDIEGVHKILGCLKNRYASIRQWGAFLVTQLSQNVSFVKSFIHYDGLKWLIEAREMRFSAPSWESAIEAVFSAYLPAKFAYTGRLDLHDLTQEGFYILRYHSKIFFVLDDLLEIRASPAYPVYVANFETDPMCASKSSKETLSWKSDGTAFGKRSEPINRRDEALAADKDRRRVNQRGDRAADGTSVEGSLISYNSYRTTADATYSIQLQNFASCPKDPYLQEYLGRLKNKLAKEVDYSGFKDPQWLVVHPRLIRQRAQILARFVADEMSGPDPDPVCKNHCFEIHLNDIRYELETNIIPLGFIRIGSYLERALLFKILADKIGLPCALVRGIYGRAWVEIAIPAVNVDEKMETKETQTSFASTHPPSLRSLAEEDASSVEDDKRDALNICEIPCYRSVAAPATYLYPSLRTTCSSSFPTRLLKPNAIVDLVHEPGRILRMDTYEADEYKGCFLCMNRTNPCP